MKKKSNRKFTKFKRSKKIKKNFNTTGVLAAIFFVTLFGLFSETIRTKPAGAFSERFQNITFELPHLNSKIIEKNLLNKKNFNNLSNIEENFQDVVKNVSIENQIKQQKLVELEKPPIIVEKIEKNDQVTVVEIEKKEFDTEIKVAKVPKTKLEKNLSETFEKKDEIIDKTKLNIPKIKETTKIAADTSTTTIIIDGEEKIIAGSSDKNISYIQILQNPNDLDLNLKYARQQGKVGNFKQTIATLERLNMLYPDNLEIKLYLLSVLVQADSPNKALTIIEDIKSNEDVTQEDLATVNEIEEEMKARGAPKLWNFYASLDLGGIQNNNVNSVSKTRTQSSSDSIIGFNSAKIDRTYSGSLGLTAIRSFGEASSFSITASGSDSDQEEETGDDFESYNLSIGLDTALGNQSLSPYLMIGKTDYQDDADSFSLMWGISGYFPAGDQHSFNYSYSYSDAKGNQNSTDTTADATNAIGHSYTLGHDFMLNEIVSTSLGIGYSDSDGKDDTNDFETYDFNFRINFAYPWAYISIGEALGFNDYKKVDTSINSNRIRSDVTSTFDIMVTKAVGDFFPSLDPNKSLFLNLSYEKLFSEANIINYDYISDSIAVSFSKSFHLNK